MSVESSNALPAWFVKRAQNDLHEQRAFRVDQLNRLDTAADATPGGAARDEVDAMLREAAQSVLTSIDVALRRIERGSYGHCQRCGDLMSLNRLAVQPMANWCWLCQRTLEMAAAEPA
jgi:DnaK suppressor protein